MDDLAVIFDELRAKKIQDEIQVLVESLRHNHALEEEVAVLIDNIFIIVSPITSITQ